ncbi:NADH-quinone oxidoreductase subunit N domain protein [Mycobacterium xenopi 4042]|uniref:NADH-quinone oxidoreductase subunit N domain protein n=1 Tax=Mycobacterium xenopi 4042 TaxID=1299334 RepID=X7ZUM0_MYCXE|nr:NADH-quinone oxidoreductase subunit N domain protein [Mycobacterium xenopi 4042]EUA51998.1 NADH-quinone oxidoreductase subunit N domain protein [Mycobacterium xenopi 3993]
MSMTVPCIEYGRLSPMLIVFGAAVVGLLVEAFVAHRNRYSTQLALAAGGLVLALVAVGLLAGTMALRLWVPSQSTGLRCSCKRPYCRSA